MEKINCYVEFYTFVYRFLYSNDNCGKFIWKRRYNEYNEYEKIIKFVKLKDSEDKFC